jgi:hypothetical protein
MYSLKEVPGVEISIMAHQNWEPIKEAFFEGNLEALQEADFSINIEATISAGASLEADVEGVLQGSNGTVEDQSGLSLISNANVPVNVGACVPAWAACGKATAELDFVNETVDSIGYQAGMGEGVDVSADLFSISFPILSGNIFTKEYEGPNWDKFLDEVIKDVSEYGE